MVNQIAQGNILVEILLIIGIIIVAPILGGFISGIDRIITARMQGRVGPPILQPFYDFIKLLGKERITLNQTQAVYILGYLFFAICALIMLIIGSDLLMLVFVLAFSAVSFILGALSLRSPYSKIGAQREIIQLLAYEPVLIIMAFGVYNVTGSFQISKILTFDKPLILYLPLVFFAFLYVLTIKLRKSPFDFSTSHHGHQELIKGITTEFAGPQLALIELTHWYETVLLMGLIALFFVNPWWVGVLIAIGAYFLEIVIDNISARVTWKWMLKATAVLGIGVATINLVWLYVAK